MAQPAFSDVNLQNGNFFLKETDLASSAAASSSAAAAPSSSSSSLSLTRVYNSKTSFRGIFGEGWGSEYEVKLRVSADGHVWIREFGGGAEHEFVPISPGTASPSQFISLRYQYQYITKIPGGYKRTATNGRTEDYNDSGLLTAINDGPFRKIRLLYNPSGKLLEIKNMSTGESMNFDINAYRLVKRIRTANGATLNYEYNSGGELISYRDSSGKKTAYSYSDAKAKRHLMEQVTYHDGGTLKIGYYPENKRENVRSIQTPDGLHSRYEYIEESGGPLHLKIKVSKSDSGGKNSFSTLYDYTYKTKSSGARWLYELKVQEKNAPEELSRFNECCELPMLTRTGSYETKFDYDQKGRLIQRTAPDHSLSVQYHPILNRITKVLMSGTGKTPASFEYKYDASGLIVVANENDSHREIRVIYDSHRKIRRISEILKGAPSRQLDIKYGNNLEIESYLDSKLGRIRVNAKVKMPKNTDMERLQQEWRALLESLLHPSGERLTI